MTIPPSALPMPLSLDTARLILPPLAPSDIPVLQRRFPRWQIVCHLNARIPWLYPDDGESRDMPGFWLDPDFQGRGLMTEAADRVTTTPSGRWAGRISG